MKTRLRDNSLRFTIADKNRYASFDTEYPKRHAIHEITKSLEVANSPCLKCRHVTVKERIDDVMDTIDFMAVCGLGRPTVCPDEIPSPVGIWGSATNGASGVIYDNGSSYYGGSHIENKLGQGLTNPIVLGSASSPLVNYSNSWRIDEARTPIVPLKRKSKDMPATEEEIW